ncbi:hypothetical protein GGD50_006302 [Rhizobium paranaense]|uniref:Uncharacterized protein n=1 Tax=Rhizobium paranaense TaxID=1650438 RepID=A0A7W8XXZ7_9HYPH|nr:hypothetical protein [Rhizobium paranaense]MBB5577647.1 hypothetical protein [Rhizobium paranaense]
MDASTMRPCLLKEASAHPGQPAIEILLPLRTHQAFQFLVRRAVYTTVPAPQKNLLEHGANRLPGRAQFASDPQRQLFPIGRLQASKAEMLQNLGTMPARSPAGEIILGHGVSFDTKLLGQPGNAVGGNEAWSCKKKACAAKNLS